MNLKSAKIVFLFIITVLLTEGVAGAQGFGHSAVVGMTRRFSQIKNFQRPLVGKGSYLKSGIGSAYDHNLSVPPSVNLTSRVAQQAASASLQAAKKVPSAGSFLPRVPKEITAFLPSSFQARPGPSLEQANFISGTVFKTTYDGQEEIFGVIPMHALGNAFTWQESVGASFTADLFDPTTRRFISVPAEIVQISTPEFLDAALVKFRTQDEKLLHPLSLNTQMPTWHSVVSSQGFAARQAVYIPQRRVIKTEPFTLQTTIPFSRDQRKGLCGGPVVDQDGRLVGIHNGSSYIGKNEAYDKGYITPAWILERLVQAYKNDGKAKIPLTMDGKTLIELNVDEYISHISLKSSGEMELGHYTVDHKFSYNALQELLEKHYARYIDFTVHHVRWNEDESFVLDSRFDAPNLVKIYRYDTETDELKPLEPVPAQTKKKWDLFHLFGRKN